jgi:hypothetical protein
MSEERRKNEKAARAATRAIQKDGANAALTIAKELKTLLEQLVTPIV